MRILFIAVLLSISNIVSAELTGQHLASVGAAEMFANYLKEQGIDFKVDEKDPTIVWWSPDNDEHMKDALSKAFKTPSNQRQLLPKTKQGFERAVSILEELNIRHVAQLVEGTYVVLWFPNNSQQQTQFTNRYNNQR